MIFDLGRLRSSIKKIEVPKRSQHYVKRPNVFQEIVIKIKEVLTERSDRKSARFIAITGGGGTGKTQAMLDYYLHSKESSRNLNSESLDSKGLEASAGTANNSFEVWLNAESDILFIQNIKSFLSDQKMGIEVEKITTKSKMQEVLKQWMNKYSAGGLICLDNANDSKILHSLFDNQPAGWAYLVTTRNPVFDGADCLKINLKNGMEAPEIMALIKESSGLSLDQKEDKELIDQLSVETENLPLFWNRAGDYIYRKELKSVSAFQSHFKKQGPALLSPSKQSGRPTAVDHDISDSLQRMFKLDFEYFQQNDPLALHLYNYCAHLHCQLIPQRLLELLVEPKQVEDALEHLCQWGLLGREHEPDYFRLHRIDQAIQQQRYETTVSIENRKALFVKMMASLVQLAEENDRRGKGEFSNMGMHYRTLSTHVLKIGHLNHSLQYGEFLSAWLNNELISQGYQSWFENFLKEIKAMIVENSNRLNQKLGSMCLAIGQIELDRPNVNNKEHEAEYYLEQSVAIYKNFYGEKSDYRTANALHELGRAYLAKNEQGKAQKYFEESLKMFELVYPDISHRSTVIVLSSLAWVLKTTNPERAEELLSKALKMSEDLFGKDTADQNTALVHFELGQLQIKRHLQKAEQSFRIALSMYQGIFPNQARAEIALAQRHLGLLLLEQGKFDEAALNITEAHQIQIKLANESGNSWSLVESYFTSVKLFIQQKEHHKAIEELTKAMNMAQKLWESSNKEQKVFSALFWVIKQANLDLFNCFMEKGKYDLEQRDERGRTAVLIAAESDQLEILKILAHKGANFTVRDRYGNTLLLAATETKTKRVLRWLVEFYPALYTEILGDTPLLWAIRHYKLELAETLLREKNPQVNTANNTGFTPALLAALTGNLDLLKKLYSKGANLSARTNMGEGIIFLTILGAGTQKHVQHVNILNWLAENSFDLKDEPNIHLLTASQLQYYFSGPDGQKALHSAFGWTWPASVDSIVDYGAFISYLIALLKDSRYTADMHAYAQIIARCFYHCHLENKKDEMGQILMLELQHTNPHIQESAILSMPNIPDREILKIICEIAYKNTVFTIHAAIIEWLVKFPEPALEVIGVLNFYLKHPESLLALYALHQMKLMQHIPAIKKLQEQYLEPQSYQKLVKSSRLSANRYKPSLVKGIHLERFLNSSDLIFTGEILPDAYINAVINLRIFGNDLGGMDLVFDHNNTCILGINNTFSLHLTYESNSKRLYLYSPLLDNLPNDVLRLRLYERLLEGSMLGAQMAGGGVGVATKEKLILIHVYLDMAQVFGANLKSFVPTFINVVEHWRKICAEIMQENSLMPLLDDKKSRHDFIQSQLLPSIDSALELHERHESLKNNGDIVGAIKQLEQALAILLSLPDEDQEFAIETSINFRLDLIKCYIEFKKNDQALSVWKDVQKLAEENLMPGHFIFSRIEECNQELNTAFSKRSNEIKETFPNNPSRTNNVSRMRELDPVSLEETTLPEGGYPLGIESSKLETVKRDASTANIPRNTFIFNSAAKQKLPQEIQNIELKVEQNKSVTAAEYVKLASAYHKHGDTQKASEYIEKVFTNFKTAPVETQVLDAAHYWQANFLLVFRDYDKALEHFSKITGERVENSKLKAKILIEKGDLSSAISILRQINDKQCSTNTLNH